MNNEEQPQQETSGRDRRNQALAAWEAELVANHKQRQEIINRCPFPGADKYTCTECGMPGVRLEGDNLPVGWARFIAPRGPSLHFCPKHAYIAGQGCCEKYRAYDPEAHRANWAALTADCHHGRHQPSTHTGL